MSKEVVSFLNAMLQFNSEKRLSCNELSRHYFLTKNVNDFQPIDLRKVSNKVNKNNLNVNIKRNSTIWSIFNEDDEKQLINIPSNYLTPVIKKKMNLIIILKMMTIIIMKYNFLLIILRKKQIIIMIMKTLIRDMVSVQME